MAPLSPLTVTGTLLPVVVPLPSSPSPLLPHALTVPSLSRARLWIPPAETAVTPLSPLTATGVVLQENSPHFSGPLLVPLPSCPERLAPQAMTAPSLTGAALRTPPTDNAATPPNPLPPTGPPPPL